MIEFLDKIFGELLFSCGDKLFELFEYTEGFKWVWFCPYCIFGGNELNRLFLLLPDILLSLLFWGKLFKDGGETTW